MSRLFNSNEPERNELWYYLSKDSRFYHVFRFLDQEYRGDVSVFLKTINSFLALDIISKRVKNKTARLVFDCFKYGIPATIYGMEFYQHIKRYREGLQNDKSPVYLKRITKLAFLLKTTNNNMTDCETAIGHEIILWLLTRPNTKQIKIIEFYDENLNEFKKLSDENTTILILFEYKKEQHILETLISSYGGQKFVEHTNFILNSKKYDRGDIETELRQAFVQEFIVSLNISKNTLHFRGFGSVQCKPRTIVEEEINQFNVHSLIGEINNVLNSGRKRAYAFVSRPGTGKSTILRKIEELITDRVIFKLSPYDFTQASTIRDRFAIIKKIPGSIVFIEDLDACGMAEKNKETGVFLDEIDDSNNDLNLVILVTINDTSRVHFSIINRPGRFDKVFEIKSPQSTKEIYEVILSKTKKLKQNYFPTSSFSIPSYADIQELLEECLKEKFTQAEITDAIVEQIFLDIKKNSFDWDNIGLSTFKKLFTDSIESHQQTLIALKKCNFNNSDPNILKLTEEPCCEEAKTLAAPLIHTGAKAGYPNRAY